MKKKMSLLLTFVLILGISTNALAMDNAEDSSESYKVLLPETFSFDVTMDEIANSIDQYIVEHNMKINRNTEEYAELLHNFCFSDFPDLTETELRYYQAYASVYLSKPMSISNYVLEDNRTIGEIKEKNQQLTEKLITAAEQWQPDKVNFRFSAYDLYAAREYAHTYALTPNPNFDYHFIRGDCTNFASQILYAGGMSPNSEWTFDKSNELGHIPWINANAFMEYWTITRGFMGPVCRSVNDVKNAADAGDFIAWHNKDTYAFYHIQFVQTKTADREIYCTQHTPNYYNEKFSSRVSDSAFKNEYVMIIDFY